MRMSSWIAAMLITLAVVLGGTAIAKSASLYVDHFYICRLAAAEAIAETATEKGEDAAQARWQEALDAETCQFTPGGQTMRFEVLEVVSGPYFDPTGEFYVVRVGDEWYVLAWPGRNSNVPVSDPA